MEREGQRKPTAGGTLVFRIPYGARARFDWHLDRHGHDVLVECKEDVCATGVYYTDDGLI